jgi:CheY-like chemotaxis protein
MSSRASVLVIDDEPGMREMLSYELTLEGFEVETAESGMVAVEAIKRRRFDLAVTDLKMPGMDGLATVEALRSLDPDIEVIVATGYATVETAVACMKRGAYDYIEKPYDLARLKLLLERAMQKSYPEGVVAVYDAGRALLGTIEHADLVQLVLRVAQQFAGASAPPPPERVPVRDIVRECLVELGRDPRGCVGDVSTDLRPTAAALVSRGDLRAAVLNILSFLGSPGRRRSPGRRSLEIQTDMEDGRPAISIHDSTLLLSTEERRRIFDPRVDVSEMRRGRMRLDLGLALAYQLLRRNGAEIELSDGDGVGALWRIRLPIAPEEIEQR